MKCGIKTRRGSLEKEQARLANRLLVSWSKRRELPALMMSMGEKNLVRVRRESNSTAEVVRLVEEKHACVSRELREQLSALLH